MVRRLTALGLFLSAGSLSLAQQALTNSLSSGKDIVTTNQSAPESAWLDLRQNAASRSTTQTAPDWVEAVSMSPSAAADGSPKTVFRIRVTHPTGDYGILFLR